AVTGVVGTRVARTIDTYRLMPDAWIERQTRASLVPRQTMAWKELTRRFLDNALSSGRTARLVDAALARQADEQSAWLTDMGDFVEAVHRAKALPGEKWLRYAKQAPLFTARARKRIRRGDPIVVEVSEDGNRVGAYSVLLIRPIDVHVRGGLVVERPTPDLMKDWASEQMGTGSFRLQPEIDEDRPAMMTAAVGEHAIDLVTTFEVLEGDELDPETAKALFRDRRALRATFELVEPHFSTVEIIPDDSPDLRKRVEAAIEIGGGTIFAGVPDNVYLRYSVTRAPVPLAFRMIVRQGDFEKTGSTQIEAGSGVSGVFALPLKELSGDRVDVIFEPDVNVALESIDATRMWNGRIVFTDVPIKRDAPIERPQ
ncbi:MAG: hypothetical protein M3478_06445, partial [Planctomycetota bacterium]|nr:hypothetical protein [Planctomycetota bacterium]